MFLPARPVTAAAVVTWGTLAVMTYAAIEYCLKYSSSIPAHNTAEFLVPVFTGSRPFTLKWLLEDPGHSTLLHKLVFTLVWRIGGRNFMALHVFNVLALAAVSALMMLAARDLRGRTAMTDAVIPLAFLRLGQSELLLQVGFWESLWVVLLAVVLYAITRQPGVPRGGWGVSAGIAVILLPLNGYLCIAASPPLIVWLAWLGSLHFGEDMKPEARDRRRGLFYIACAFLALGVLIMETVELDLLGIHHASRNITDSLRGSIEFVGMSLGTPGRTAWPYSAIFVMALWITAAAVLVHAIRLRGKAGIRTKGLLLFLAALFMHALLLGWGRGGGQGYGFAPRYITRGALLICWIYLAWGDAAVSILRRLGQHIVVLAVILAFPFDAKDGIAIARSFHTQMDQIEYGVRSGMSAKELTARYWPYFVPYEKMALADLVMLERARLGPYRIAGSPILPVNTAQKWSGNWIRAVAFSPDGRILASAGDDGEIRFVECPYGRVTSSIKAHSGAATAISWSRDGGLLASAGWDGKVLIWDARDGRIRIERKVIPDVSSLAFSPDGASLALGYSEGLVELWDLKHDSRRPLTSIVGDVGTMAFSPDGAILAIAGSHGLSRIAFWDVKTSRLVLELAGHTAAVCSVSFSPDGKYLASGGRDMTARIWTVNSGDTIRTLTGHEDTVSSLAFSSDGGGKLATGSWDGTVRLWDISTGHEMAVFRGHGGPVSSVDFSPDGKFIASGSWDGTVRYWRSNRRIMPPEGAAQKP